MNSHGNLKYQSGMDLCPREGEALLLAALGNSTKESARIMNAAACTVKGYLDSAREKLSARNIAHAVSLAWEFGLIASKHLCTLFLIITALNSAVSGDIDQRNVSRIQRIRNGRRQDDNGPLPVGLDSPEGFIPMNLKQWKALFASARNAA
jgi:DNA-binding CsgD family transcriptional regulator